MISAGGGYHNHTGVPLDTGDSIVYVIIIGVYWLFIYCIM